MGFRMVKIPILIPPQKKMGFEECLCDMSFTPESEIRPFFGGGDRGGSGDWGRIELIGPSAIPAAAFLASQARQEYLLRRKKDFMCILWDDPTREANFRVFKRVWNRKVEPQDAYYKYYQDTHCQLGDTKHHQMQYALIPQYIIVYTHLFSSEPPSFLWKTVGSEHHCHCGVIDQRHRQWIQDHTTFFPSRISGKLEFIFLGPKRNAWSLFWNQICPNDFSQKQGMYLQGQSILANLILFYLDCYSHGIHACF